MTDIDRAALIEAAAKAISTYQGSYLYMPDDCLSVIAAGLLAPIRAQIAEWREFMHQPDMTSFEKSAIRMCASELGLLLDQIEADVRGGER